MFYLFFQAFPDQEMNNEQQRLPTSFELTQFALHKFPSLINIERFKAFLKLCHFCVMKHVSPRHFCQSEARTFSF
jgi:hypothetical protein